MKKLLLACLIVIPHQTKPNIKAIGAGASALGLYLFYRWFRQPATYKPTIENMNTVTIRRTQKKDIEPVINIDQLVRTIHEEGTSFEKTTVAHNNSLFEVKPGIAIDRQDDTVCIFSRGYAKVESIDSPVIKDFYDLTQYGGGAKGALIQCIDHIAPDAPIIGFDYFDNRRNFSMGGYRELECLDLVMDTIEKKNPNANIILIADCRGAGVALRHAAKKKSLIKALVLMSPFVSGRELSDHIAQNYLSYLPFNKTLLHTFFRTYYPCYFPEDHDTVHEQLKNIPADLPIFITHRKKDSLISPESLERLQHALEHNKKVQFFPVDDESAPHSKLTHLAYVQNRIQKFYQEHQLVTN